MGIFIGCVLLFQFFVELHEFVKPLVVDDCIFVNLSVFFDEIFLYFKTCLQVTKSISIFNNDLVKIMLWRNLVFVKCPNSKSFCVIFQISLPIILGVAIKLFCFLLGHQCKCFFDSFVFMKPDSIDKEIHCYNCIIS